jgi:two-component system cell cycle sensor histidine kinase/response regulator CckA
MPTVANTITSVKRGPVASAALAMAALTLYVASHVLLQPVAFPENVLPVCLGAGLAFALLLVAGERWFPVLLVARLILLLRPAGPHLPLWLAITDALVYTAVYALGAAALSRRVVVTRGVWRVRDVAWLLAGTYMSAIVQGTTSVLMRAWRPGWAGNGFWQDMSRFAAGDGTGMLLVVPLALFVIRPMMLRAQKLNTDEHVYVGSPDAPIVPRRKVQRRSERLAQGLAVLATISVAVVTLGRGAEFPNGGLLLLILPLAWLALREGLRGSTLVLCAYGVASLLFARYLPHPAVQIPRIQSDLLILGIVGLLLAAARSASAESAARYWQLVATAAEGIWRLDTDGKTLSINPRMADMLGRGAAEVLGRSAGEFIAEEDLAKWQDERRLRAAGMRTTYEVRLQRPDGERITALVNASPVRGVASGENIGTVAVVTDITALRAAELQGRRAQVLLEAAFHSSHDAMELHRVSDGVIIEVNAVWSAVTGHSRADAVGRPINSLGIWGDPADSGRMDVLIREHGFTRDFEITFNRQLGDGRTERGHARLAAIPVQFEQEAYMLVTARDISEEKRAEEAQSRLKRMEELGRLAGGVAHDFNNLLTVIGSYAQLARMNIEEGQPVPMEDVDEILSAADRGQQLTRRLLSFSRHRPAEAGPVDLGPVLLRAEGMVRSLLPPDVTMRFDLGTDVPTIMAGESQLDQIVLNLVVNARDAMPDGGEFVLRTSALHVPVGEASVLVGPDTLPGHYAVLSATDTGVGMDAVTQSRIFEPFFTTKGPSEGTGLGLAVIYGIVRQAHGAVRVTSEVGAGTTFTIYWPAAPLAAVTSTRGTASLESTRSGGRVLLIEDEPTVRRITCRVLEDAGFEVSVAADGGEGLACLSLLKAEGRRPDVVLSDISMPVLNGRQMAARMLLSDPDLPVVLVSGYDEVVGTSATLANVPFPVVMKPYEVATLISVMRAAIEWHDDRVHAGNARPSP